MKRMRGQSTSYTRCLWGTPIRVRDYVGNDDVWDIIERGHEATHHLLNLSRGSQREYALDCETGKKEERKREREREIPPFRLSSTVRLFLSVARFLGSFCVSHRCLSQYLLSS